MKIAFKTFGCRANSVDTELLHFKAQRDGFEVVREDEVADAYIINSCTVTQNADKEAQYQIRKFKNLNPQAKIALIGCYGQVAHQRLQQVKDLDFVLGTADKDHILSLLKQHFLRPQFAIPPTQFPKHSTGFLPQVFLGSQKARASVKVQDGCNYRCSYCIIPQARGRSRSLPPEVVLSQIKSAFEMGFKEIVLTGIHLAHYGWDHNTSLVELLYRIFDTPGPRIRLSSLDPFEIGEDLISLLKNDSRLCPYFHIALQSGDNTVLKKMRRLYRQEEFVEITQKIQGTNPDTFIGVDVIVGFPSETTENFENTLNCLQSAFWAKLHVFPFSPRKDTEAYQIEDTLSAFDKKKRANLLRTFSDRTMDKFIQSQIGKTRPTLIERSLGQDLWIGRTDNYLLTLARCSEWKRKQIYQQKLICKKQQWVESAAI